MINKKNKNKKNDENNYSRSINKNHIKKIFFIYIAVAYHNKIISGHLTSRAGLDRTLTEPVVPTESKH